MVRCDKVDGQPCSCELEDPPVVYLIQTIISNSVKLVMGTLTQYDREVLRDVLRIPSVGRYVELYLEELDKHRELVSYIILNNE